MHDAQYTATHPTTSGGGFDAVTDTIPGQHSTDPVTLSSYWRHGVHVATLVAPDTGLNLPAAQG
jgi:hypothetical protein